MSTVLQWSDPVPDNVIDVHVSFPDMPELNPNGRRNDKTISAIRDAYLHRDTATMISSDTLRPSFFVDAVPEHLVDALVARIAKLAPGRGFAPLPVVVRLGTESQRDARVSVPYVTWTRHMTQAHADARTWDALRGAAETCLAYDAMMQRTMQWSEASMLDALTRAVESCLADLPHMPCANPYPSADVRKGRINHVAKDADCVCRAAFSSLSHKKGMPRSLVDADK